MLEGGERVGDEEGRDDEERAGQHTCQRRQWWWTQWGDAGRVPRLAIQEVLEVAGWGPEQEDCFNYIDSGNTQSWGHMGFNTWPVNDRVRHVSDTCYSHLAIKDCAYSILFLTVLLVGIVD